MQDGMHLLGDGHFDVAGVSQAYGCSCGEDSFGDHAVHAGDDLGQFLAAAEFDADAAVAREAAGASEDQVAESGESGHGFGAAAAGDDEASHLRKPARDQRGDGIVSQPKAVADSGGDGNDVLERASEFDADYIAIGVDAKAGIAELLLHGAQEPVSGEAIVMAVGSPRATSCAKEGPLSAPSGCAVSSSDLELRRSLRSCVAASLLPGL